ncbi:hypothetical protein ANCDUO_08758 [Ancylostoma duodenale]|uniref:Uncharacterized protein n=1 Tax=Ancylostoma duodenale TaxID=51022 RepID=A0A0C2GPJ8_9BILA|nr:hypothetical protein ANCDUO_08758 [Ancylostoma duodenale]
MKSVLVCLILLAFISCVSSQCCYGGGYYGGYGGYGYSPYYGYYSPWRGAIGAHLINTRPVPA